MVLYYCNCKGLPSWTETLFCGVYLYLSNCSLELELSIFTVPTVHRGSRSLALLFLDHGSRNELSEALPGRFNTGKDRDLFYRKLGVPRNGLDNFGKSRPHRDSNSFTSSS